MSQQALPDKVAERLERFIGMTGSDQDGEALNAIRMAWRLAVEQGMTLGEALDAAAQAKVVTGAIALDLKRLTQLEADAVERGRRLGREEALREMGAGQRGPRTEWTWPLICEHCLTEHPMILTDFERSFLQGFLDRGWAAPTQKQLPIMQRIAVKCGVTGNVT